MKLIIDNFNQNHLTLIKELANTLQFTVKEFNEFELKEKDEESIDILDTTDYNQLCHNPSFNYYFRKVGGTTIKFYHKRLEILDEFADVISVVYYSSSLPRTFKKSELMQESSGEGARNYYVFENGHDDKNWLFTLKNGEVVM